MPNYYPPATSAGGGGTPDDNSVTSAKIVDGAIVNADINAAAAIAYSKLALTGSILNADVNASADIAYSKLALTGSIVTGDITDGTILGGDLSSTIAIPSAATAATQTAADGSTKIATTAYVDTADALKANLAGPTFTGVVTLPTGAVATTQSANDNSTKLSTTAYADRKLANTVTVPVSLGANTYANFWPNLATAANAISGSNGNARFVRVVMPATGTLHDVSFGYDATSTGNFNIIVLDDGQANATHTTRTCLYIKGSTAATGALTWATGDANLAVTIGDTLVFCITSSETTSTIAMVNGKGPIALTTSFFPGSGASTASLRVAGTIASASVPGSVNATVTDANLTNTAACALVTWRIT